MSWKAWTAYGFGYEIWTKDHFNKVIEFIIERDNYKGTEMESELRKCEDSWDVYGLLDEFASQRVAEIINKAEGLTVVRGYAPCGDTDQEEMLGIEPCYPWTMTKKDKQLTREQAYDLLVKYGKLLGIAEEPDYFDASYCG